MTFHPAIRHAPDPDHPGWWSWDVEGIGPNFNHSVGKVIVRSGGPGRGECRMFPGAEQRNLSNVVHGGALMAFIDVAMFAGSAMAGAQAIGGVTLDCSVQFIGPGKLDRPLDAEVDLLKETGSFVFVRGRLIQGEHLVAAFSGALRKPRSS